MILKDVKLMNATLQNVQIILQLKYQKTIVDVISCER